MEQRSDSLSRFALEVYCTLWREVFNETRGSSCNDHAPKDILPRYPRKAATLAVDSFLLSTRTR